MELLGPTRTHCSRAFYIQPLYPGEGLGQGFLADGIFATYNQAQKIALSSLQLSFMRRLKAWQGKLGILLFYPYKLSQTAVLPWGLQG